MQISFKNIALPLLLVLSCACVPIFTGEGEEIKSIKPGPTIDGLGFAVVEKAHPLRRIEGSVYSTQGQRKIFKRFLKVCLLSLKKQRVGCISTDSKGAFAFNERLKAGKYILEIKNKGDAIQQTFF